MAVSIGRRDDRLPREYTPKILAIKCPHCGEGKGWVCTMPAGGVMYAPHGPRRFVAGLPYRKERDTVLKAILILQASYFSAGGLSPATSQITTAEYNSISECEKAGADAIQKLGGDIARNYKAVIQYSCSPKGKE